MTILCPECNSPDGHYQVVFEDNGIKREEQGTLCPKCKGLGQVPYLPYAWVYSHQDTPGEYYFALWADTKEELEAKLLGDCGRLIDMRLQPGLVAVQVDKSKFSFWRNHETPSTH